MLIFTDEPRYCESCKEPITDSFILTYFQDLTTLDRLDWYHPDCFINP